MSESVIRKATPGTFVRTRNGSTGTTSSFCTRELYARLYLPTGRPDLVLLSYDIGNLVKGLNTIGVETMLLPAPKNFEEILLQIRKVGEKTGNAEQSNKLANKMNSQMKDLITLMKNKSQI